MRALTASNIGRQVNQGINLVPLEILKDIIKEIRFLELEPHTLNRLPINQILCDLSPQL